MNTKLFAFSAAFALYSSAAFCSPQDDIAYIEHQLSSLHSNFDLSDNSELNQEIACNNISYLETYVIKALKRCEEKLSKYKAKLKQNENSYESDDVYSNYGSSYYQNTKLLKKIEATQSKIKAIKEILFGIQVLKLRMAS